MTTSMGNTPFGQAASPEPAIIRRPLDHCPACNSWQLRPIVAIDAETVHFLCGSCNRCWHVGARDSSGASGPKRATAARSANAASARTPAITAPTEQPESPGPTAVPASRA